VDSSRAAKRRRLDTDAEGLNAQRAAWLLSEGGAKVKGAALRCMLCQGALLLNSGARLRPCCYAGMRSGR
jgi:hypothetical protein